MFRAEGITLLSHAGSLRLAEGENQPKSRSVSGKLLPVPPWPHATVAHNEKWNPPACGPGIRLVWTCRNDSAFSELPC